MLQKWVSLNSFPPLSESHVGLSDREFPAMFSHLSSGNHSGWGKRCRILLSGNTSQKRTGKWAVRTWRKRIRAHAQCYRISLRLRSWRWLLGPASRRNKGLHFQDKWKLVFLLSIKSDILYISYVFLFNVESHLQIV